MDRLFVPVVAREIATAVEKAMELCGCAVEIS
jgi:hypothetical protein